MSRVIDEIYKFLWVLLPVLFLIFASCIARAKGIDLAVHVYAAALAITTAQVGMMKIIIVFLADINREITRQKRGA